MDEILRLDHANIMAFVTSRSYGAPRVSRSDLSKFLDALASDARRYFVTETMPEPWTKNIAKLALRAASQLRETQDFGNRETLPVRVVERILEELRSEFAVYSLFALPVGSGEELRKSALDMAHAPMYGSLLVFIPEQNVTERNIEVLDPVPAFSVALHAATEWPGFVFWTSTGVSAFATHEKAKILLLKLRDSMRKSWECRPWFHSDRYIAGFDAVLRNWESSRPSHNKRLLHLSDLHFGSGDAAQNQSLLDAELHEIVKSEDRVVITGDLFDSPKEDYANLFMTFKNTITRLTGREPISIPGNHDLRFIGLFGNNYEQVAKIGSTGIVVDEQAGIIFICFNSSEKGNLARGKITKSQFKQVGAEYRSILAAKPALRNLLPIVLVHHHPFSYDVQPETWVQRALSAVGLRDETFLEMVDAGDLHQWCLDWKIKTILHGHKHKARYVDREVTHGAERMQLTAIGCGTSLGAEGLPLSYNLLEWSPTSQQWIASFFESVNGGAFREVLVSVSPKNARL